MNINSIGNLGNSIGKSSDIKSRNFPSKIDSTSNKNLEKDYVSISKEALEAQDFSNVSQIVEKAPDVRFKRVEEIREKIKNNEYDSLENKILDKVAEKIALALLR